MATSPRTAAPLAHRHQTVKQHGVLSPEEWAELIVAEARALHLQITPREVAEGVATTQIESSGNSSNEVQGPQGHIGGWAEGTEGFPSSPSARLDPRTSTRAALQNWATNGKSWWDAWGKWEKEQAGIWGGEPSQYKKFLPAAEAALKGSPAAAPSAAGKASAVVERDSSSGPAGGLSGGLMHAGMVGVLVLGGVGMIGFGATRMLGASAAGKALSQ